MPSYSDEKKPKAIDLSHHYADAVKDLKNTFPTNRFMGKPGIVNLDGGVPATAYFPIESVTVEHLKQDAYPLSPTDVVPMNSGLFSWITSIFSGRSASTKSFTIPRYLEDPSATEGAKFELKSALTYSPNTGLSPLEKWVHDWSGHANKPAFADWDTLITTGAMDGWTRVVRAFLNPEEGFLTDDYSYSKIFLAHFLEAFPRLTQCQTSPLLKLEPSPGPYLSPPMLKALNHLQGKQPRTDYIHRFWEHSPRLLYTQGGINNPTGQILTTERKKAIYDIAVRYDIIIVEDDPYRWQEAPTQYLPPSNEKERVKTTEAAKKKTDEEWLDSVTPSFLNFDYQGRVIRIDTFSKTIGPGARLGYYTTSPSLRRILDFLGAASNSPPSGLTQAIVGQLLYTFQRDGFTRWIRGLGAQYELRRNWSFDVLFHNLHIEKSQTSSSFIAYRKGGKDSEKLLSESLFSFVPPAGGMFVWFAIHLQNHPSFPSLSASTSAAAAKTFLAGKLWNNLGEGGVLFRLGELFAVPTPEERAHNGEEVIYLRASYSSSTREELERAFIIFADIVVKFFDD
ncbi:pyridoxal phosphate-dependent transferase [Rhodocollybia butyracea]|uniref:Pyridoxal phosphate-dependent transferase n=1 Tax=Rhodocollybia butyracea TaxID=206335 RepID=A0A9P5PZD5_9AGAR|nr:pyridoxal phosphate-dependent transferase [Rhodocollybia butyracea]